MSISLTPLRVSFVGADLEKRLLESSWVRAGAVFCFWMSLWRSSVCAVRPCKSSGICHSALMRQDRRCLFARSVDWLCGFFLISRTSS